MSQTVKTRTRYCIIGSDFSAQEPRLLCHLSQEPTFMEVFKTGKDPYATISQLVFKKDYWECMEHHQDGTPNPAGKKLRKKAKGILLGILYGMGPKLMSEILGVSKDECKDILNEFYTMFPAVKKFTEENEQAVKQKQYVEDYMGRRRHLPDAILPEVEIRANKDYFTDANVFMDIQDISQTRIEGIEDKDETNRWQQIYNSQYANKGFDAKTEFKELAKKSNISVFDNGAFISKTFTQCTNARIQGSASTLTKKAMINIRNNKRLQELGFRILIPIHDELLGECPVENAEEVCKLLGDEMVAAGRPECTVDMAVDPYVVNRWYADEVSNTIYKEYNELCSDTNSSNAIDTLCTKYPMLTRTTIEKMCNNTYDVLSGEL